MGKQNEHTHKFERVKFENKKQHTFRCIHPTCMFIAHKSLILGKKAICNNCGEIFLLSQESLRLAKPHCEKCYKGKRGERARKAELASMSVLEAALGKGDIQDV